MSAGAPVFSDWFDCYGGSLKSWLVPAAFQHPAKFSRKLIERIYAHVLEEGWLKPGQRVLDPMAGVSVGGIAAANVGLLWSGVELEPRFVALSRQNFAKHQRAWTALGKSLPTIRQGDARYLQGEAEAVVSSPPYADQALTSQRNFQSRFQPEQKKAADNPREGYAAVVSSPPYADAINAKGDGIDWTKAADLATGRKRGPGTKHYETLKAQQSYDAVVTSPPFSPDQPTASQSRVLAEGGYEQLKSPAKRDATHAGTTPGQIGALPPGGVRAVITSPPYASGGHHPDQTGSWGGLQEEKAVGLGTKKAAGYGQTPGQIGRMAEGDVQAIVTSPPYEASINVKKQGQRQPERETVLGRPIAYGSDQDNVGNLAGETYWSAMRQVYENCFGALPPGGHIILVVKGFVRKGAYVDLPTQTCQLLEAVGFRVIHRHKAWLIAKEAQGRFEGGEDRRAFKSFFRRLQERKGGPRVDFECVVCAEKP